MRDTTVRRCSCRTGRDTDADIGVKNGEWVLLGVFRAGGDEQLFEMIIAEGAGGDLERGHVDHVVQHPVAVYRCTAPWPSWPSPLPRSCRLSAAHDD